MVHLFNTYSLSRKGCLKGGRVIHASNVGQGNKMFALHSPSQQYKISLITKYWSFVEKYLIGYHSTYSYLYISLM